MSAAGIPQIAAVMGSCTAGGAYVPAMSDETVIVKRDRHDLPRRPAAREGRDRRGSDRRGVGRRRRARAHLRGRRPLRRSPTSTRSPSSARSSRNLSLRPPEPPWDVAEGRAAPHDPSELYGIVPATTQRATTSARSSPASSTAARFHEFKALYGETLVCGFARIEGFPVGILANNGVLFSE